MDDMGLEEKRSKISGSEKKYGYVLAALATAATVWCVSKFGAVAPGDDRAVVEALSLSATVLGTIFGVVFTVLTLVLNLRAFPIRVIVPRLLVSEEVSLFAFAFAATLICDVIGVSAKVSKEYLVLAAALFTVTLILLLTAVHFILNQLTLEDPLDQLAKEFSDSLGK